MNLGNWVFSVMPSTVSALGRNSLYIFDTYQPILIIFAYQFVNKINVISCAGTVLSSATRTVVDPPSNP